MSSRKRPSSEIVPWTGEPVAESPPEPDLRAKEEMWHEAWRRKQLGQSTRSIGRSMGKSQTQVCRYIAAWENLLSGSEYVVSERRHQVAAMTELERNIWKEAQRGDVTWAAAAGPLRAVWADKRDLLGVGASGDTSDGRKTERPAVLGQAAAVVDELDARRNKAS